MKYLILESSLKFSGVDIIGSIMVEVDKDKINYIQFFNYKLGTCNIYDGEFLNKKNFKIIKEDIRKEYDNYFDARCEYVKLAGKYRRFSK